MSGWPFIRYCAKYCKINARLGVIMLKISAKSFCDTNRGDSRMSYTDVSLRLTVVCRVVRSVLARAENKRSVIDALY